MEVQPCSDGTIVSEEVVKELVEFGYKTIQEIEDDLNKYEVVDQEDTYIGVLRNLMIIKDCEKYFEAVYAFSWGSTDKASVELWKKNGVKNIETYLQRYDISVVGKNLCK